MAIQLIMAIASQIQQQGGVYIRGQAVENSSVQGLYQRFAHCFPTVECYVPGRIFRQLVELSGKGIRDVVKTCPNLHRITNLEQQSI